MPETPLRGQLSTRDRIRWATPEEVSQWDAHITGPGMRSYVLQARGFAAAKHTAGWTPRYLVIDETVFVLALEKRIPLLGRIWYIPKGPAVAHAAEVAGLLAPLRALAREQQVFLVSIDPQIPVAEEPELRATGLEPRNPVQMTSSTIEVDLSQGFDQVMAQASSKLRHGARKAAKLGVVPGEEPVTETAMRAFYDLLIETAHGAGFPSRPYAYYEAFWYSYAKAGEGHLFFSRHEGEVVTGAYVILLGDTAYYKDGASRRKRSAYGTSDALQLHILEWLTSEHPEITRYDMMGCPPAAELHNPEHPLYGIGFFKKKVSENVVDYTGAFDLVIRPRRTRLWRRIGWPLAARWAVRVQHQTFY